MSRSISCVLVATQVWVAVPIASASGGAKPTPAPPAPPKVNVNRTLPKTAPLASTFSKTPVDSEFLRIRVFDEPLVPVGATSPAENAALAAALTAYRAAKETEAVGPVEDFLAAYPKSAWRAAALMNLGIVYRRTGYFRKALTAWEEAWTLSRAESAGNAKAIADRAVAELAELNARLGRVDRLTEIFSEVEGREIGGSAGEKLVAAKEGLWKMQNTPEIGFRCGPLAVDRILAYGKTSYQSDDKIVAAKSTSRGTSLVQVRDLAVSVGLPFQIAKRTADAEIIVPAVVHWKAGHFAALVSEQGGRYQLQDPTFGNEMWVTRRALNEETTGYFLVRAGELPAGWSAVTDDEGATIWGKGAAPGGNHQFQGGCPEHSVGGSSCHGNPVPPPPAMPDYTVNTMLVNLHVEDTPASYTPPVGPRVDITAFYNSREIYLPSIPSYSNLGPNWRASWLSFIEDDPTNSGAPPKLYGSSGGQYSYGSGGGGSAGVPQRAVPPHAEETLLTLVSTNPIRYERRYPDGSVDVYAQSDGGTSLRRIFLSQMVDPQGNAVTINYAPGDINNPGVAKILGITDAVGQVTVFEYDGTDPLRVTKINDPFGRSAIFEYDNQGRLNAITDVIGMRSTFGYAGGLNSMTTPYGTTNFRYGDSGLDRLIEITDPLGGREIVLHTDYSSSIPQSEPVPPDANKIAVINGYMYRRNTFYWDKRTSGQYPDWTKAHIFHFMHDYPDANVTSGLLESEKKPLERRVWYDYGQAALGGHPNFVALGMWPKPIKAARVLDDGSTQLNRYAFNTNGNTTMEIDPLGREVDYEYDTNGIDVLRVKRKTASGYDLLQQATYNGQHEPLTVTDASGQTTNYNYYSDGRLYTVKDAKNETWTLIYDANKYLTSIQSPVPGAATTVTWDGYGRPYTITNADNYTVTLTYDALDRPLRVTYPNNTYEEVVYDRLNVGRMRDLLGRWTTILVDSLKRPVAIRDPKNQVTQLIWCGCGGLSQLIDPKGHATTWTRDLQNRPITRTAADNTTTTYTYEATTSRLKTVTDAKAQTSTFDYFLDNRLKQVAHTGGTVTTPNVSLTYDPIYSRVATRTDGTGTTIYNYNPVNGAVGAGRLASVDGPWANDTITYGYDELGRTTSRSINGVAASVTYDSLGRQNGTTNPLGALTYGFDGYSNRVASVTSANGPSQTFSYYGDSGDRQLQQILNKTAGGTVLSQFNYTYNSDDTIATWTQQLGADPATAKTYSFQYDAANRLTSALLKTAGAPQSVIHSYGYSYDDQGNRTSEQVDNVVTTAIHNVTDELTTEQAGGALAVSGSTNEAANVTVNGQPAGTASGTFRGQVPATSGTNNVVVAATDASGNTRTSTYAVTVNGTTGTLTYDLNGNLKSDATRTYEWDSENRLTAINQGTHRSEFSYDGFGRRVEIVEKDNGAVTSDKKYLWVGRSIAEERDSTGATTTKRFFAQGFQQGGQAYFYTKDHLGSIREVVDSTGVVRAQYSYDPSGRRTKLAGDLDADFGYTGYFEHAPSGLKLAMYRAYDANLGRYISRDPIGLRGGRNLYAYVRDNPVNYIDPYGLKTTVIITTTPAWPCGEVATHAAMLIDNDGDPVLYDPAGSYRNRIRGSGDYFEGDEVNLKDYLKYHQDSGDFINLFEFNTTKEEEAEFFERIQKQGTAPPGACANRVSGVLSGVGVFKTLRQTIGTGTLYRQLWDLSMSGGGDDGDKKK